MLLLFYSISAVGNMKSTVNAVLRDGFENEKLYQRYYSDMASLSTEQSAWFAAFFRSVLAIKEITFTVKSLILAQDER